MDQHPVPQDITGFQFKLVGDMTIEQFGYLLAGGILAFITFSSDIYILLKIPLAGLFAFGGIAFAFMPIQERPLKIWVINFIRSIYKPTQYVWRKTKNEELFSPIIDNDIVEKTPVAQQVMVTVNQSPTTKAQLADYLSTVTSDTTSSPTSTPTPPPANLPEEKETPAPVPVSAPETLSEMNPKPSPAPNIDDLLKLREDSQKPEPSVIEQIRKPVNAVPKPPTIEDLMALHSAGSPTSGANNIKQKQLTQAENTNKKLLSQIDNLESQISTYEVKSKQDAEYKQKTTQLEKARELLEEEKKALASEIDRLQNELKINKKPEKPAVNRQSFIDKVPYNTKTSANGGLPGNMIHGLVDDHQNQPLFGVIVTIKNGKGIPVRALRTNKLGQFIASTPMESGDYTIEAEKEGFRFPPVSLTLDGNPPPLITIIAEG